MNCYEANFEPRQLIFYPHSIMKRLRSLTIASVAVLAATLAIPVTGEPLSNLLNGITRDSATGMPLAGVQILAHTLDGGTDRVTVTNTEGAFTFTDLEPGRYEIAASKS